MTPSEQPDDLAELIDRHEVVTDVLRRHGCVLIGSSEDRKRFRQSLDSLGAISPDAKKLWETTFSFLKSRHRHLRLDPETAPPWDDVLEVEELAAWSGRTAVVALSPEQAALLGVEGSASSKLDENVELQIAKGCSLRSAQPFKRYASLERHGVIPHGYDRDHWFDEVLLPLVCEAREIYVVDRY